MEEADRRDQARREKAAKASKPGEGASRVEDAPRPEAEESVEEELLKGSSEAQGIAQDAQPEDMATGIGAQVKETMVHGEL
jgi:protein disulfide-isomerase A6